MTLDELMKAAKEGDTEDKMPRRKTMRRPKIGGMDVEDIPMPGRTQNDRRMKFDGIPLDMEPVEIKGRMLKLNKGGKVSSASSRADGIAQRGKTRGRFV